MSSELKLLAKPDIRDNILKAELAGLLHNLGKLDPNFLANVVEEEDKPIACQELKEQKYYIPDYRFKRFSAPDLVLLQKGRSIIGGVKWSARIELAQSLLGEFKSQDDRNAIQELVTNWEEAKKIYPLNYHIIEAAWQLNDYLYANGPLYRCSLDKRDRIIKVEQEINSFKEELKLIQNQLLNSEKSQKKELGTKKNSLKKTLEELDVRKDKIVSEIYQIEQDEQATFETKFRAYLLEIVSEKWALADLLTLFWDDFFYQPNNDGYKRQSALEFWFNYSKTTAILSLMILSHAEISIAEKKETTFVKPKWNSLHVATAFGYERQKLNWKNFHDSRHNLLSKSLEFLDHPQKRKNTFKTYCRKILETGLGDTQWPINDINLWDYASTISTLFKAGIAKAILEKRFIKLDEVKWHLLSIRYDGLSFLNQSHHISDLLARRDLLNDALEEVKAIIEVDCPMGNEIYRDENGAILIVPHLIENDGKTIEVLDLPTEKNRTLASLLQERFSRVGSHPLDGELKPSIALSQELHGKEIKLQEAPGWKNPKLQSDPESVSKWWENKNHHGEVCTVCSLRPQGYVESENEWKKHTSEEHKSGQYPIKCNVCKAQSRSICGVCLERRSKRSEKWALNKDHEQEHTIWINEVADTNGRIALLMGRFDLDGWLEGTLIETMQKSASFARVRRCWETTRKFWEEVLQEIIPKIETDQNANEKGNDKGLILKNQKRLRIGGKFESKTEISTLGRFHVYELDLKVVKLNAVWVPPANEESGYFLTADNLCYIAKQLNGPDWNIPEKAAEAIIKKIQNNDLTILEASKYETPSKVKGVLNNVKITTEGIAEYAPLIKIIAEPSVFMALVPAEKANDIALKIKRKFEIELGKVRDRLPIHLGIIYAPRRTPLRAILDAGRNLIQSKKDNWKKRWSEWEVEKVNPETWDLKNAPDLFRTVKFTNGIEWELPMKMGNDKTPDYWYLHFLSKSPDKIDTISNENLIHASELKSRIYNENDYQKIKKSGSKVFVNPSTFDFEFLDTSGRRFEIFYDKDAKRPIRPNRPYLLDELVKFGKIWDVISDVNIGLTNSQINALIELIEKRRTDWKITNANEKTFNDFIEDALKETWGKNWSKEKIKENHELLKDAAASGMLADVIELYMKIMKKNSNKK
ncbi:MAG: hypothetical protein GF353_13840 [Candidatus Lokiarchaeota archaeon]|nr:hypothetical protein [Candidatus Lokiarchaeota archaeon]